MDVYSAAPDCQVGDRGHHPLINRKRRDFKVTNLSPSKSCIVPHFSQSPAEFTEGCEPATADTIA